MKKLVEYEKIGNKILSGFGSEEHKLDDMVAFFSQYCQPDIFVRFRHVEDKHGFDLICCDILRKTVESDENYASRVAMEKEYQKKQLAIHFAYEKETLKSLYKKYIGSDLPEDL